MSYKKAYEDHQFLFGIGIAADMTGGYVDSEDLDTLLKSPSKKTAERICWRQIDYWFQVGTEDGQSASDLVDEFPRIRVIADDYGCDF